MIRYMDNRIKPQLPKLKVIVLKSLALGAGLFLIALWAWYIHVLLTIPE